MNVVGHDGQAHPGALGLHDGGVDLEHRFAGVDHHFVVNALEQHALHHASQLADILAHDHNILRPDDHVHRCVFAEAGVHAGEIEAAEVHQFVLDHGAAQDVAFADEVGHEGVGRFVIHALGVADLQNMTIPHDDDGVAHGQGFFLIVGHIDERDPQLLLHALQFQLHFLAQFQVQRAQRLVQQQNLRLVHQRPSDSDTLLLAAGKLIHAALAIALQVDQLQHPIDLHVDLLPAHFLDFQAEGDVVPHIQVRKQRVFLEHGIHPALVGRHGGNILAFEQHSAGGGILKPADNPQRRGLSAAGGAQQRQKLLFSDVKINIAQNGGSVELLGYVFQIDEVFLFHHDGTAPLAGSSSQKLGGVEIQRMTAG